MDLEYLRGNPHVIPELIHHQRIRVSEVGNPCPQGRRQLWTLDDGTLLFAKFRPTPPKDFFQIEAWGLDWLRSTHGPRLPEVIAVQEGLLVLEWIPPGKATPDGARRFGRELARMHGSRTATQFGAPLGSDVPDRGFVGPLELSNAPHNDWAEFFVTSRCLPYLRLARDAGAFDSGQARAVEQRLSLIAGLDTAVSPAPIHGDLWSGNVHYAADGSPWLIDAAAAHYGNPETDLATLHLFGAPFLNDVMSGYTEASPPSDGWRERMPAHQLHLLLVHAAIFGAEYAERTLEAARSIPGRA